MSRIGASAGDFFVCFVSVGDAAGLGVALGLALGVADDEDLLGEGEASVFLGVGDAFFWVVTETVGSLAFSRAVAFGEADGEASSSWDRAKGETAKRRARATRV